MFNQIQVGQVNANLQPEFQMRVGIPHSGGRLAVHAFNNDFPAMVSASAFWNTQKQVFRIPESTDLSMLDFALDSAGFTAMLSWKKKGPQPGMAGVFPWSYSQYLELASFASPSWYSQADACCEKEVANSQEEIDYRINVTATLLEGMLRTLYAWQNELARTCTATAVSNLLKPPVPVIQGWAVSDYMRSLELVTAVWERWQPWLVAPALIGIGSVCRRDLHHPDHGLFAILDGLETEFPRHSRAHLFGVKGTALPELCGRSWIASSDSMAWDLQSRIKAHRSGVSNTFERRTEEMSAWMSSALRKIEKRPPLYT